MSFRPRFFTGLVAILAFVGVATHVSSCTLDPYGTQTSETLKPCAADANCDDKNPCTIDTCQSDNTCAWTNETDGPLKEQIAGDCRRDDCMAGQIVSVDDDADILDDGEPCTTDGCSSGTVLHDPLMDGTMCTMGNSPGKCSMGACEVECGPTKPCNDNNPCTEDSCNAGGGTCTFAPLDGLPTPGFQEPVGDCKIHICDNGVDAPLNDDADVPDDMNSCTQNVCVAGTGSNPGVTAGTPCVVGQPDVCNGQGSCVQCNVPEDCVLLPTNDDCKTRTCVNNVCGQTFATAGKPIASQTAGDCKQVVCDGTGGTVVENLDADVPEDNNPCTKNVCTAGAPSNPDELAGFSCGNPLVCNGAGDCVGCNVADDCVMLPPTDFCKERTCVNSVCVLKLTPAGTDLPMGQTSLDCKVVECDTMGNIVTSVDLTDKPVDGNQCSQDVCSLQGVPSNPPEPLNTNCSQMSGTVCNGAGLCKKANGATCDSQNATQCLSGNCVDGVCCNAACGENCKSCNVPGSVGTCVNVPKASEDLPGCTNTFSCDGTGVCKKDNGQSCTAVDGSECSSGFCVDGVCCNAACGGSNGSDCQACSVAAGAAVDGTCAARVLGTQCRASAGVCDAAEVCDGTNAACPADAKVASGTQCRASGGVCDVAEVCDGTNVGCPADGKVTAGTQCRASAGVCDVAESCDGTNVACPADTKVTAGTQCRASGGVCDVAESCDGTNVACPADAKVTAGTQCRASGGVCDVAESCDGMNVNCPTDAKVTAGTQCRASGGVCDVAESCDGTNVNCPTDAKVTAGTQCRAAGGVCDVSEACDGSNVLCPADAKVTAGTQCRAAGGVCDLAEACDGSNVLCPTDAKVMAGTQCRAAGGVCDLAEACDGSNVACPTDAKVTAGTECRASGGVCDIAEACDGSNVLCPADAKVTAGTECRAAGGVCDLAEACDGSNVACPNDAVAMNTVECRAAVGTCDIAEFCDGTAKTCPTNVLVGAGMTCRADAGSCDVVESCDGMVGTCPTNAFEPANTVCVPVSCTGNIQTNADTCNATGMCIDNMTTDCSPFVCGATTCLSVCAADADCVSGFYCSAGACLMQSGVGAVCDNNNECTSGNCVDGFCCNTACTGTCQACNVAGSLGTCSNVAAGDDDAIANTPCTGTTQACDGAGACKKDLGELCVVGSECAEGSCADGYCCDAACSGTCEACSAMKKGSGTNGTCGPIAIGTDPDDDCTDAGATTCSFNGSCNGTGACQLYAAGTTCTAASCSMNQAQPVEMCDGAGTCVDVPAVPCSPFVCGATACLNSCTVDTDCQSGFFCNGTTCVANLGNGVACTRDRMCGSSFCVDSVCCNVACSETCKACINDKTGSSPDGTCDFVATGTDPDNDCPGAMSFCDGAGMCN